MELFIYIQSPIFNAEFKSLKFFEENESKIFQLDTVNFGLRLENISDAVIQALIEEHIKEVESKNFSESLLPFDGGVYIQCDLETIASNCCGDISDVENWKEILKENNKDWETIWIGHPQIAYKFDTEHIYFSTYFDASDKIDTKFIFDKNEFIAQMKQKINLYEAFKIQAYNVIDDMQLENAFDLKKVLF